MAFEFVTADIRSVVCDAIVEFCTKNKASRKTEIESIQSSNCKYIIRVSLPFPADVDTEMMMIRSSYRSLFKTIAENKLYTVAVPLHGFHALNIAPLYEHTILYEEVSSFLRSYDAHFLFVAQDNNDLQVNPVLRVGLQYYLEHIEQERKQQQYESEMLSMVSTGAFSAITDEQIKEYQQTIEQSSHAPSLTEYDNSSSSSFSFLPGQSAVLEESFKQMLFRKINEKGFKKDPECYTRANIDKNLFSQIRCKKDYHPSKNTALALCIALELPIDEAKEFLMKAGYSLSHSILSDVIVEYCIMNQKYNIFEVNELLYDYNQPILGKQEKEKSPPKRP